jgi:plastocyanin
MKKLALLLGTGVLAVGIAATSSQAASAPAHSASHVTRAQAKVSRLSISAASTGKLAFSTRSLKAKAGKVIITFTNHAPEAHNLTVVHGTNGAKVGATPTFTGGSKTLTLNLKAGKYTYYCSVPGHRMGGMQGTLTVS